jgi:hypothetical protein
MKECANMKKVLIFLLAFLLSVSAAPVSALQTGDQTGTPAAEQPLFFEKPEDAIVYFAQRIAQGDFSGALNTMADMAMAEKYDLTGQINRLRAVIPTLTMPFPSGEFEAYLPLSAVMARAANARGLYGFITSLLIGNGFDLSVMHIVDADGKLAIAAGKSVTPEEYVRLYDPQRLEKLLLRKVYLLNSQIYLSERYQENIKVGGAVSGYTDRKEFAAFYDLDGERFYHTCTVGLFEKGWQILSLNAAMIGTPTYGNASFIGEAKDTDFINEEDYLLVYDSAGK